LVAQDEFPLMFPGQQLDSGSTVKNLPFLGKAQEPPQRGQFPVGALCGIAASRLLAPSIAAATSSSAEKKTPRARNVPGTTYLLSLALSGIILRMQPCSERTLCRNY
jgi:hypothetical protein